MKTTNSASTIKRGPYIKPHLSEKRAELIWALSQQGYDNVELGAIFGLTRQRIFDILATMPDGWKSPWIKFQK